MSNFDTLYQQALDAAKANKKPKARAAKKPRRRWSSGGGAFELHFDEDVIETIRAEFLELMTAADSASNYDEALTVKEALNTWRKRYDQLIYEDLVRSIDGAIIDAGKGSVYQREKLRSDAEHWEKKIRKETWDLSISLALPLERIESVRKQTERYGYDRVTKQDLFNAYVSKKKPWLAKTKKEALGAWKVLKEFVGWLGSKKPVLKIGADEVVTIEGFQVNVTGYGRYDSSDEYMGSLREALKRFRGRAQKVFPWILRNMLPIEAKFDCKLDEGGRYHGKTISVCISGNDPGKLVHITAHEMGHHVWKNFLSREQQKFWETAIAEDRGKLSLGEVADTWIYKAGEKLTTFRFLDWLKDHDPITYLKFDALVHSEYLAEEGLAFKVDDVNDLLGIIESGKKMVNVPENPITVYANKNKEEAFCEAFGYGVAFGPRSLLPEVRSWLHIMEPSIKVQ